MLGLNPSLSGGISRLMKSLISLTFGRSDSPEEEDLYEFISDLIVNAYKTKNNITLKVFVLGPSQA